MNRALALTLSATLSLLSAADASADNVNVPSRVQAATIFPSAVSIRRAAHEHFVQGEHALRFGPLPTGLIDESIRLNGVGPGLTTEGFTIRTGTLGEATPNALPALTETLAGLLAQRTRAIADRESIVRGIDPRQLQPQGVRALAEIELRLRSLSGSISARSAELEQLRARMNTPVKYVIVDVTTSRDGDADLTLDYLLPNAATWTPSYTASLSSDGGTVSLDVMAAVQQSTGEDWAGVRLTVSSVNPAGALALPSLEERNITLGPEPEREVAEAPSRPRPTMGASEPSMARPAARSMDDMIASLPVATPIEHRTAVVRANLLSARLEIATLVSLRTGALPRRVLAAHSELPCSMEHQAAPRHTSAVFLTAKMRNHNAFPLLSGPVALFVDREYVGASTLPDVPVDEEVFVPFGVDPSVTVDRTLAAHAAARQGSRDQSSVRYDYRVSNHRDRAVDLVVFEQLPVSRSAGLLVRTSGDTRNPSARREHDAPGTLRWNLHLLSGASDRWHLGMTVDSPHGREIEGETN